MRLVPGRYQCEWARLRSGSLRFLLGNWTLALCFVHLAFGRQKGAVGLLEFNIHPSCCWEICLMVSLDWWDIAAGCASLCSWHSCLAGTCGKHAPTSPTSCRWQLWTVRWCEGTLKIHSLKSSSACLSQLGAMSAVFLSLGDFQWAGSWIPPEVLTAAMNSVHSIRCAQMRLAEAEGKWMNFPQSEVNHLASLERFCWAYPIFSGVWRGKKVKGNIY